MSADPALPDDAPRLKLIKTAGTGKADGHKEGRSTGTIAAKPGTASPMDGLTRLLKFETTLRKAASLKVLKYTLVSDANSLLPYDQAYLVCEKRHKVFAVDTISNFSAVIKDAPLVRRIGRYVTQGIGEGSLDPKKVSSFPLQYENTRDELQSLPFRHALWVPLHHERKGLFAGILYLRRVEWQPGQIVIAERMSETAGHAWLALTGAGRLRKRFSFNQGLLLTIAVLTLLSFVPVPLRVLAPFEITPHKPGLVTAPLDGTLKDIKVDPNTFVRSGEVLFTYEQTSLSNEYLLAESRLAVAEARRMQLEQSAIRSDDAKAELAKARADEKLARAERDYAMENLSRVEVKAGADGLVLFSDKKDWLGKPLQIGERVMEIARSQDVEVTIDLPIADDIALENGLPVRLFLNSDPLNAVDGRINRVSQRAVATEDGQMVYKMTAQLDERPKASKDTLIGNRGIAQIESRTVSLFFFVLRKPITAMRQYFGL